MSGRTTIEIYHNLMTVRDATRIGVLEEGRISEGQRRARKLRVRWRPALSLEEPLLQLPRICRRFLGRFAHEGCWLRVSR